MCRRLPPPGSYAWLFGSAGVRYCRLPPRIPCAENRRVQAPFTPSHRKPRRSASLRNRLFLLANVSLRPVLDPQTPEADEVLLIRRRQHESAHVGNRRNLTVHERGGSAERFKSCPFFPVPRRRSFVVRQDGKRALDDITQIRFERRPPPPLGQPPTAVRELMPDWRRDRTLRTALTQTLENRRIGSLGDGRRNDACVEKVSERHRDTLRPVVLSRVETEKSSSKPISSRECRSRNFLYASLNCRRFPRSRSNSRRETSTATGWPRRVSSTSMPDSAWLTMLGSCDLASAIEYLRVIRRMYIMMYMIAIRYWAGCPPVATVS